ncbi:MAG: AAA family ATPase [Pseudomonadota bacterium]
MTRSGSPGQRAGTPAIGEETAELVSLGGIAKGLWRSGWIILTTTVTGLGLAYHYAYHAATPTFRATASIVLETGERPFIDFDETTDRLSGDTVTLNTQIGVIRGFDLLGRVVDALELADDPAFNSLIRPDESGRLPADGLAPGPRGQLSRDLAVRSLADKLQVKNLPNSLIFEISVSTANPIKSTTIANTIAKMYIAEQVERKVSSTSRATAWLRNRVQELQYELRQAEARVENFRFSSLDPDPDVAVRLEQLTSETEAVRTVYRYLLTRLQETTAQQGLQRPDSRILSSAMLPLGPATPRHAFILTIGGLAGLLTGLILAFVREATDRKIRRTEQIERLSGLSVIGELPEVTGVKGRTAIPGLIGSGALVYSQALEKIIVTLLLSRRRKRGHVLVLMSARPGEGKTSLALSMTQRMAGSGMKALLVDGDTRKRTVSRNAGYRGPGLRRVLDGSASLSDAATTIGVLEADVIGSESSVTNQSAAQNPIAMERFFEQARAQYDVIIVDTPPTRAAADGLPLAKFADSSLLLSGWNRTRSDDIRLLVRNMRNSGIEPTYFVMTRVHRHAFEDSYYSGYLVPQ